MKKIALAAAAVAMVASTPAFAQSQSGGDGIGTYNVSGTADSFCQLGSINASSQGNGSSNVTINYTTPNSGGFSGGTSDALINITDLQDENDHAAAWRAVINMRNSVCNSAFTVTASAANGGLQYQGSEVGTNDFTRKLDYTLKADFDNRSGNARTSRNLQNGATLMNSNRATAGNFRLVFDGDADTSKYLLAGEYSDVVTVTMSANTGTGGEYDDISS